MYTIGIDIGGTNIRLGLLDREYKLSAFEKYLSKRYDCPEKLTVLINEYVERYDVTGKIAGICIGFPATVSKDKSTVLNAPNFKGFDGVNIKKALEDQFNLPIFIDKDVNLLILSDLYVNKCFSKDIAAFYIGTGLGNAIMINGQLLSGFNGVAGELGHIPFGDSTERCGCGNDGCCENLIGGKYLEMLSNELRVDISDLFEKHQNAECIVKYVDRLARIIATEINILDPDTVILGGGVLMMKSFPTSEIIRMIKQYTRKPLPHDNLKFILSKNASEAGVIGAGISAWKKLLIKVTDYE